MHAYNQEYNLTREKQNVKCVGAKLRNAIGRDIWDFKSVGMGLKMEGMGEIWVGGRGGSGEKLNCVACLTTTSHHYFIYIRYIYMSYEHATAHTAVRRMDHQFIKIMQPAYCLGGAVQPDEPAWHVRCNI